MSVNKAVVIGHLGADPKVFALPSGSNVASLSVATNERFTDRRRDVSRNALSRGALLTSSLFAGFSQTLPEPNRPRRRVNGRPAPKDRVAVSLR